MMRGCPATGRLFHVFDKNTHRCRCGRWERGFKPKTEPASPRDECQICEREQALLQDGTLVHHGYKRPGIGFIEGDCYGVKCRPFPQTDALERYLFALNNHIDSLNAELKKLPSITSLVYEVSVGRGQKRKDVQYIVKRGDEHSYHQRPEQTYQICVPSFDELLKRRQNLIESNLRHAYNERERVEERIKKGVKIRNESA